MNSLLDHLNIGDFASIASLLLTIIVFINVRKIRAYYRFTARISELVDRLTGHTSELEYYLSNFENFLQPIEVELAKSEVTLESLEKRVDRPTKRLIKQILTQINDYQRTRPKNKVLLQRIHTQMKKAIEKVKDLLRNR